MRITPHLAATRFGANSPIQTMTGVFVLLLLWAVTLPASGEEEITAQALESALQDQGWQVQHQSDGSSLVVPPEQAAEEFVFREQTPEETARITSDDAINGNQPESQHAPAEAETEKKAETAKPDKVAPPVEPSRATAPVRTGPSTLPHTHPRYGRSGPNRYWRNRPPYRSRAWQRHRHHRGPRYPWRGYGYRRGPRYGYLPYYAPPYGPAAPVE